MFKTIFFEPLYNALVFLSDILPGNDIGWAIIILTIIVRLILFPLYHKSAKTQSKIKELDPILRELKEKHGSNREEHARKMMELYREHGISPLTSLWLLLIQIPVLIALFSVFQKGFNFDPSLLYTFINAPEGINAIFLGIIDLTVKSWPLALLTGITQFIQSWLAIPPLTPRDSKATASFADDFGRSMNIQMKYVMPVILIFISYQFAAALSLYWVTSNCFSILHELIVKRKAKAL